MIWKQSFRDWAPSLRTEFWSRYAATRVRLPSISRADAYEMVLESIHADFGDLRPCEKRERIYLADEDMFLYFDLGYSLEWSSEILVIRHQDQIPCLHMDFRIAIECLRTGTAFVTLWKQANLLRSPPKGRVATKSSQQVEDYESIGFVGSGATPPSFPNVPKFRWEDRIQIASRRPPTEDWSDLAPKDPTNESFYTPKPRKQKAPKPVDPNGSGQLSFLGAVARGPALLIEPGQANPTHQPSAPASEASELEAPPERLRAHPSRRGGALACPAGIEPATGRLEISCSSG